MWWSRPGFLPRRTRPMPNRPPARAASWVIHSAPVRARDGAERLDQACRRLLDDPPPPPPTPQPEVSPPCAPPFMPALLLLFNRPLDVEARLATSLEARAVLCRARGCFRGLARGRPHDGVRDGIPPCLMIAVRDGRGGR